MKFAWETGYAALVCSPSLSPRLPRVRRSCDERRTTGAPEHRRAERRTDTNGVQNHLSHLSRFQIVFRFFYRIKSEMPGAKETTHHRSSRLNIHFSIGMLLHAYLEAVTIPNNCSFRASLEARTFNSEPSVNSTESRHEIPQQHCNIRQQHCNNVLKTCETSRTMRVATLWHNPHPQTIRSKSTGALQSLGLLSNPLTPESMAELGSYGTQFGE